MLGLICLAIALHDVDGPIHCQSGEKIRLQGIGATETNGSCNPNQPCVPGDLFVQRRITAGAMGAAAFKEDIGSNGKPALYGQLWFKDPIRLVCDVTGRSHNRQTAWCKLPNGKDVSCEAIKAGVALRWAKFDKSARLSSCRPKKAL